jgi:enamine deaminase RidA (YjgF/YER057c/UK114 family)
VHAKLINAFGRRFVHLRAEGSPDLAPDAALRDLLQRCERALGSTLGLSLENTVRTRLWARTPDARTGASAERRKLLDGSARASSSSYIAPDYFHSAADVGLELLALEPSHRGSTKLVVEYDPPAAPPMYVAYDGLGFFSGVNDVEPTLEAAVAKTIARIAAFLARAGSGWDRVEKISAYVAREYRLQAMERVLLEAVPIVAARTEYVAVDGYAGPGVHAEIEVTASVS